MIKLTLLNLYFLRKFIVNSGLCETFLLLAKKNLLFAAAADIAVGLRLLFQSVVRLSGKFCVYTISFYCE